MYLISIIIPVYNVEESLDKAFNSIKNQTIGFNNLEVIFVDDASTDNSSKILSQIDMEYYNVKVITLQENSGNPGKPRNIGIENANSNYLMFLDPDDYFEEDACELLYTLITESSVDMVMGNFNIINRGNTFYYPKEHLGLKDNKLQVTSYKEKYDLFNLAPSIWTKIFKKSFINENNLRFIENRLAEDLIFYTHALFLAKGIIYVDKPIVNYVKRDYTLFKEKSLTDKRTKKEMSGFLQSYMDSYNLFLKYDKQHLKLALHHPNYWFHMLTYSNLTKGEKLDLLYEARNIIDLYEKMDIHPRNQLSHLYNQLFKDNYLNAIEVTELLKKLSSHKFLKELFEHQVVFIFDEYDEHLLQFFDCLYENSFNIKVINLKDEIFKDYMININKNYEKIQNNIATDTCTSSNVNKKVSSYQIFNSKDYYIKYIIEETILNDSKITYLVFEKDIYKSIGLKHTFLIQYIRRNINKYTLERKIQDVDIIISTKNKNRLQHEKLLSLNLTSNENMLKSFKNILIKAYYYHNIKKYENMTYKRRYKGNNRRKHR